SSIETAASSEDDKTLLSNRAESDVIKNYAIQQGRLIIFHDP
ncbi:6215_t:CDS:1, partial [Entrophospora sp. SA101]